jgi:hypothetical protein
MGFVTPQEIAEHTAQLRAAIAADGGSAGGLIELIRAEGQRGARAARRGLLLPAAPQDRFVNADRREVRDGSVSGAARRG